MIKIEIIAVGKDKDVWVSSGCEHYLKMLKKYCRLELTLIPALKGFSSLSPNEIKKKESEVILSKLERGLNIALVDSGKKYDSIKFAFFMEKAVSQSGGKINFIIGGAYGLDDSVLDKADYQISLSPLTFSHQVVRLVLLEQLFRAFSIIHNTDYHK